MSRIYVRYDVYSMVLVWLNAGIESTTDVCDTLPTHHTTTHTIYIYIPWYVSLFQAVPLEELRAILTVC